MNRIRGGSRPNAFGAAFDDLAAHGFVEEELLVEGEATGHVAPESDETTAPFRTRVLVRRPTDRAQANGAAIVEWLNVSVGHDIEVAWSSARDLFCRNGYTWVGVSAQPVGVAQLAAWDPERYGALVHPGMPDGGLAAAERGMLGPAIRGETFSDDVFAQVGTRVRAAGADRVIAAGQSQSSGRLTSYLAVSHRDAPVFDGFLLHAGGGWPMTMAGNTAHAIPDVGVPVIKLNSEREAVRYLPYRQPDSERFRYWEVAGTGHTPRRVIDTMRAQFRRDLGREVLFTTEYPHGVVSIEYVVAAALHHLDVWVRSGVAAPVGDLIEFAGSGDDAAPAHDVQGNARGGIRLPHVDAPRGRHLASNAPATMELLPGFVPFDETTLTRLYPSPDAYVEAVTEAATHAVNAGFLLPEDLPDVLASADVV